MSPASLLVLLLYAQTASEPQFSEDDLEFFEKKVRPVLVQRCYECHSASADKPKAEFFVDNRAAILQGGESGEGAIAGDTERSRLIRAITYDDELLQMPPEGKMPAAEIEVLKDWVRRGLPFPTTKQISRVKPGIDLEAGRKHWAFQPVHQRSVDVTDPWVERKIDGFVLEKLRHEKLTPAKRASREKLIRRLKFDLVGLPPDPDEVQQIVRDESPQAYAQLVDRYLASPQYGERWGRIWLDMTRYADVLESWRESEAKPFLYRDWIVAAMNADLPYDDFVLHQFAADLLPGAKPEDNAALGFLGLSPNYWKELKLDHHVIKQVVAEEWEERIEAISATFLGLTVACARCHDHKFDPISQQDYYALAGVLASIKLEDRPIIRDELAQAAQAARAKTKASEAKAKELENLKERSAEQEQQLSMLRSEVEVLKQTPHFETPLALAASDGAIVVSPDGPHRTKIEYKMGEHQNVSVHIRGMAANPGPIVPRHFLSVLTTNAVPFTQGSGRRELAEAIVTESAPLAARVIVNRVWLQHFGRGLVVTPSNFGTQADTPSHPELLDDLAARFIENDWSLKWLHREIVLSATYQQSSERDAAKDAIDPENIFLARMIPRRLEVEAWRDAVLAVTGELDLSGGGAPMNLGDAGNRRRTLYGMVKRRELDDLLRLHDFPDPVNHHAAREPTITPLQQLFALNAPFLHERSAALIASRLSAIPDDVEQRVDCLCRWLFGRAATAEEVAIASDFLSQSQASGVVRNEAWRQYCHALLSSNEFLFVD